MSRGQLSMQCDCTPVEDVRYDADGGRSPTEVIVEALASATGTPPTDLPPLYETVDTEAIDRLLERRPTAGSSPIVLCFGVGDWNVFVRDDGRIRLCDSTGPADPSPVFD